MKKAKVTIVGAGFVGATAAQRLVEKEIADVVLVDIVAGLARGKALDMMQSAAVEGFSSQIIGTDRYEETAGSDILVITAGLVRKPGMSRDDLLFKNAEIVEGIVTECVKYSPDAVIVMVTNPLDAMTWFAWKKSGFPAERVIGMAGELDSARYAYFLAEAIGVSPKDVKAIVLGGHGDQMVPVPQHATVRGEPIEQRLDVAQIEQINQRTRDGGAEIVKLLQTGSAFYTPSAAVVKMVRAILEDTGEVVSACIYQTGAYGLKDVYCGVPVRLGRHGAQQVVELALTGDQLKALHASAEEIRQSFLKLKFMTDGSRDECR